MTAILAYREGRSAWIGGDGELSDGDNRWSSPDAKVWRPRPGLLSGAAGGLAWCDAVAFFDWPRKITDAWVRTGLVSLLRRGLTAEDLGEDDDDDNGAPDAILFASGRLYTVTPRGAYLAGEPWAAIGSGAREARAACAAATQLRGARRVRAALKITGQYAVGVGPPYTVLKA